MPGNSFSRPGRGHPSRLASDSGPPGAGIGYCGQRTRGPEGIIVSLAERIG
jgi:hypothetical protein